jgi:hypothetical protein
MTKYCPLHRQHDILNTSKQTYMDMEIFPKKPKAYTLKNIKSKDASV